MSVPIRLSESLTLPPDAVTQTFAFLARRGAGKSYGAMKLAEGMLDAGAQVVALDPVGVWYSLRIAADGKGKGFDILILGGMHHDVPLEPGAGAFIADLIVDRGISAVLDVSHFRKNERKRFATDFAEQLFHRKKQRRTPMHIFVEEAQVFVPQMARGDEARMLGAFEDIIKLGRNFGIGATLISQRPQSVNKDALNQTEALVVLQTNGAQERKALENWIVEQGVGSKALVDELPGLPIGTAYLWSPSWLRKLEKIKIGRRKTYDASATPVPGVEHIEPKPLSKDELAAVERDMAATIERAKQDDPKALRARIAELERAATLQVHGAHSDAAWRELLAKAELRIAELESRPPERVEVPALTERDVQHLDLVARALKTATERIGNIVEAIQPGAPLVAAIAGCGNRLEAVRESVAARVPPAPIPARPAAPVASLAARPESTRVNPSLATGNPMLGDGAASAILMALATFKDGRATRQRLGALTGYSSRKSTIRNALSRLRVAGLIETPDGETVILTAEGRKVAGPPPPPRPTRETIDLWRGKLGDGAARNLFETLVSTYPRGLDRSDLGHRSGVDPTTSTLRNALSKLRTNGLILESGELVTASVDLFPTGPLR